MSGSRNVTEVGDVVVQDEKHEEPHNGDIAEKQAAFQDNKEFVKPENLHDSIRTINKRVPEEIFSHELAEYSNALNSFRKSHNASHSRVDQQVYVNLKTCADNLENCVKEDAKKSNAVRETNIKKLITRATKVVTGLDNLLNKSTETQFNKLNEQLDELQKLFKRTRNQALKAALKAFCKAVVIVAIATVAVAALTLAVTTWPVNTVLTTCAVVGAIVGLFAGIYSGKKAYDGTFSATEKQLLKFCSHTSLFAKKVKIEISEMVMEDMGAKATV